MTCGIYIVSSPVGDTYICGTSNLELRMDNIPWLGERGGLSPDLQALWDEWEHDLRIRILLVCDPKILWTTEKWCREQYAPSVYPGGDQEQIARERKKVKK